MSEKFDRISPETIHTLVHSFYGRIRADGVLGPVFEEVVQGRWDSHLETMVSFWSSVMLATGSYKGNPMRKHMEVPSIRQEHFARWLLIFGETARTLFEDRQAGAFEEKAGRIAESLQLGLFYRPEDHMPARSAKVDSGFRK
ncbi:group III truncated hemoglobin [Kiloniella sp. b19]|uniref:group III truncated hemoglobin n=1 Tax=Kiloniella sp. GXU_MW_B19 TaxID=3141326 RepID=UPI0031D64862